MRRLLLILMCSCGIPLLDTNLARPLILAADMDGHVMDSSNEIEFKLPVSNKHLSLQRTPRT